MKRWFPFPLSSVLLLVLWLLINQSVSLGHWLLGLFLAIAIPLITQNLRPLADPYLYRPFKLFLLLSMALVEIIRSCFNVSRIILFIKADRLRSQFILVPLELRDPYGLALLSCLINSTPGTVWVEIVPGRHDLALHVFDLHDEEWWINTIKESYEKPLIEIFEGRNTS